MMRRVVCVIIGVFIGLWVHAQEINRIEDYFKAVLDEGYSVQWAEHGFRAAESEFNLFKSQLKPQVSLQASLPTFIRTSTSVVQPNGSINFQPVFQNNASMALLVEQPVLLTGGTLFFQTALDRFDDFGQRATLFNGIPVRFGYQQSLVGFNRWKWNKKIEENRLLTRRKQYHFEIAQAQLQAAEHYFDALIAEANHAIADSNRLVNEKLLIISEERLALGKISEDEKLQMEAEYKQSVMQVGQLHNILVQTKNQMNNLPKSLQKIGKNLVVPEVFPLRLLTEEELIAQAMAHAPEIYQAALNIDIQRRNAAQLKAEMSPTFEVFSTLGFAKNGEQWSDVYSSPFLEQQIRVGVSVPIVDWGRKKAAVNMSQHLIEQATTESERQKIRIKQIISQLYGQLTELQTRLEMQKELMDISERRYKISTERYASGAVILTELVFAQRNKDQAIRDYLMSLRDYYAAYYELKALTQ